jgi:hypothetical protein
MNKVWFIFKGTHHLGPFSVEEIAAYYQAKEIFEQTLIWKEGSEKWESLLKVPEFSFLFRTEKPKPEAPVNLPAISEELPPPLPSIPSLPKKVPELVRTEAPASTAVLDDLPPPIPLDAILDPTGEQKLNFDKKPKQSTRSSKYVLFVVAVIFIILMGRFWLNEQQSAINLRIKGVMPVYHERLEMTASKITPKFEVAMALSLDGQILYASTNKSGDIQTVIKLTSVPRRVLGTEDVVVTVKGDLKNHVGKFMRMNLSKGTRFLPGEYTVHAEGREVHFINRHWRSLQGLGFFKSLNKSYVYDGEALIYSGTPREFEKKMADYKEILLAELQRPYQDKLERIQTLESLLNQTSQNYLMELEKAKTGKAISNFERKFIKEISPLLQSLVLRSNELAQDPKFNEEGKTGVIAPYKEQVLLGKQIGILASDMITKTAAYKLLTEKDKLALRAQFDNRSRAIKMQIDLNTRQLMQELAKIK